MPRGSCASKQHIQSLLTTDGHVLLLVQTCFVVVYVRHAISPLLTYSVVFFVCLSTCSHSSSIHQPSHLFHTTLLGYEAFFFLLNHPHFYHHILLPTLINTTIVILTVYRLVTTSSSHRHHSIATDENTHSTASAYSTSSTSSLCPGKVRQVQSGLCLELLSQTQDWGWGSDLFCLRCGKYSHTKENYQGKRCYAKVKCNHCAFSQSDKRIGLVPVLH